MMTLSPSPPPAELALRSIVRAARDRSDLLSASGYRVLCDRSEHELPSQAAIWEMFGGFQRLRELATAVPLGDPETSPSGS